MLDEMTVRWAEVRRIEDRVVYLHGGVTLEIDQDDPDWAFILVAPCHDREALREAERLAGARGFELMSMSECLPEQCLDGSVRHWMVEKMEEDEWE